MRRRPSIWDTRRRMPLAAYPQARASNPRTPAQPHQVRPLGLASGGVYRAIPVTRDAGALLPHRFTLTACTQAAVCSLWHCPASRLGLPLAITLLCEVRTFLDPPAVPRNEPRPPGQLVRAVNVTASSPSCPGPGLVGLAVDQPPQFDRGVLPLDVEHVLTADPTDVPARRRPMLGGQVSLLVVMH